MISLADNILDLTQRRPAAAPAAGHTKAPGQVALELDGLTKSYAGVDVLRDASVEVRAGELALIVGRSGSGKSTLLMLAGNWIEPDRGTVEPDHAGWRRVAFVPQRFGLVPELTVQENIELPARLARASQPSRLLERLSISELRDRYPAEISIGQQQRVAIARALRLDPAVLIIDEPTSHQDAAHAELAWAAICTAAAKVRRASLRHPTEPSCHPPRRSLVADEPAGSTRPHPTTVGKAPPGDRRRRNTAWNPRRFVFIAKLRSMQLPGQASRTPIGCAGCRP